MPNVSLLKCTWLKPALRMIPCMISPCGKALMDWGKYV